MDTSSVAETQQESQSSVPETVASSNDTQTYEYQIPEWFLKGNIKTPADLVDFVSRVHLSDQNSPEESTTDHSIPFEISSGVFSGLRDLILASFVRNAKGELPAELPAVSFRAKSTSFSNDVLHDIVLGVAKDIGATLLSIDLEDLEDLSCEFKRQDDKYQQIPEGGDDAESSTREKREIQHYFVVEPKKDASKSAWLRVNRAISAIVNAARIAATPTSDDMSQNPLIIVNLRNVNRILNSADPDNFRPLARFCNFVQDRRKLGENIVLVTSISDHSVWPEDKEQTDKIVRESGIQVESCLDFTPSLRKAMIGTPADIAQGMSVYQAMVNTRCLKRLLRERLANGGSIDILQISSDWGKLGVSCGGPGWSRDITKQAALQITGRTFKKPDLDLDDIESVLRQLDLCKDTSDPTALGQDDNADELREWEEKKVRLSKGCNQHEKQLLSCIVNPVNLKSTYDDVILDSESKETMKYLVSMSNFCPDAKSSHLLDHMRINGALLYGPPGTGKTELSRAVAKESGMTMIAIDAASVTSKWLGEITLASKFFPCVLFIDEVDSLFYRRSDGDKSWERAALTQFLQCLDGLVKDEKSPFVITATNRPSDLDEAFLRRLPQKLFFKLPDEESRLKILRVFLHDEDLHTSVDVEGLAKATEGYSGSDLRSLCCEAAMVWTIEQKKAQVGDSMKEKVKLCLEARHFGRALRSIRPSVSQKSHKAFVEFAMQFNVKSLPDLSSEVASAKTNLPEPSQKMD
ncbi:ATPase family AAA domain-containing protein 1-A [Annulohypoxylon nitens]|nr:ATPase family AAA domain-containing protein 1-A [Annulohypoxylon nitens]